MIHVIAMPPGEIYRLWDEVKVQIGSALEYTRGELDLDQVLKDLEKNRCLLMLIIENSVILGSIVIEFVQMAKVKVAHIIACGGERVDDWLYDWWEEFLPVAKEQNCTRVSVSGRPGWVKKLSCLGFKHAYTTVDQDI